MQEIPKIALGTWKSPKDETLINAIKYAVEEAGYRHIDCAACYENEEVVGTALQDLFSRGVVKREEMWITSKLWNTMHRPENVEAACRKTLADLKLDYLDLYLVHYPCAFILNEEKSGFPVGPDGKILMDEGCGIIETWKAMEHLVEIGLVKRIGVSNFTINHLETIRYHPDVKIQPWANQVEFHLYMQQEPLKNYLKMRGIVMEGYSTLGTNDWRKPHEPVVLEDEVLKQIAEEIGQTPAAVELRFLDQLGEGKVILLAKSVTPSRIKANIEIDGFTLTSEQMEKLKKREKNYRFVNPRVNWGHDILGEGF